MSAPDSPGLSNHSILPDDELASLMAGVAEASEPSTEEEDPRSYARIAHVASLLGGFDPSVVFPDAVGPDLRCLLRDCTVATEDARSRWMLKTRERRRFLRERLFYADPAAQLMRDIEKLRSDLVRSGSGRDPLMEALYRLVTSDALIPSSLSRDELTDYRTVLGWLPHDKPFLSLVVDEALRAIEIEEILEPFRFLTGYNPRTREDFFIGRETELRQLRSFVDALEARSLREYVARGAQRLWRDEARVLIVSGTGGIGKSTLIGKFILEHRNRDGIALPFTYLDLDRSILTAAQPATLLLEFARQLGWQYPTLQAPFKELRDRIRQMLEEGQGEFVDETVFVRGTPLLDQYQLHRYMLSLGKLLGTVIDEGKPTLLIIDTFEEAQALGDATVTQLEAFVNAARQTIARLRVVIVGRDAADGFFKDAERLPLGELGDLESRRAFLMRRGVSPEDAKIVARAVSGRPLALMLAGRLVRDSGVHATKLSLGDSVKAYFQEHLIEGILYDRILNHIGNNTVKLIVHPGLVLRRVDADIIREVIMPACSLGQLSDQQIDDALAALRNQKDLIRVDETGSIWHRSDVRAQMLELMTKEKPKQVNALHVTAIHYYVERQKNVNSATGQRDRIEELYHRLAGGIGLKEVPKLWIAAARSELASCMNELQLASGRGVLKVMLGVAPNAQEIAAIPFSIRMEHVRRTIEAALTVHEAGQAQSLFEKNKLSMSADRRMALEPRILDRSGHWDKAFQSYQNLFEQRPLDQLNSDALLDAADFFERFSGLKSDYFISNSLGPICMNLRQVLLDRVSWSQPVMSTRYILAASRLDRASNGVPLDIPSISELLGTNVEIKDASVRAELYRALPESERFWLIALTSDVESNGLAFLRDVRITDEVRSQLDLLTRWAEREHIIGMSLVMIVPFLRQVRDASEISTSLVEQVQKHDQMSVSAAEMIVRHLTRPSSPQWYVPLANLLIRCFGLPLAFAQLCPCSMSSPIFAFFPAQFRTESSLVSALAALDRMGALHLILTRLDNHGTAMHVTELRDCVNLYTRWRHRMLSSIDSIIDRFLESEMR